VTAELSRDEIRACVYALSAVRRAHLDRGKPVPPSIDAAWHRLRLANLLTRPPEKPVARARQGDGPGLAEWGVCEWLGTKAAAAEIGCSTRTVQRYADDIGAQRFGRRLLFPAPAVREYSKYYERQQE